MQRFNQRHSWKSQLLTDGGTWEVCEVCEVCVRLHQVMVGEMNELSSPQIDD